MWRDQLGRTVDHSSTVNELAAPFDLTLPAVSKHLKVLERAGLVSRGRRAQFRPCAIDVAPLTEIATWTDTYRHIWDDRFDRMDAYVRTLEHTNQRRSTHR